MATNPNDSLEQRAARTRAATAEVRRRERERRIAARQREIEDRKARQKARELLGDQPGLSTRRRTNTERIIQRAQEAADVAGIGEQGGLIRGAVDLFDITPGRTEAERDANLTRRVREEQERRAVRDAADPAFDPERRGYVDSALAFGADLLGDIAGNVNPTYLIAPGRTAAQRIASQAGLSGAIDVGVQGEELARGIRDEFSPEQAAISTLAGGLFEGAAEAAGAIGRRAGRSKAAEEAPRDTNVDWFEEDGTPVPPARQVETRAGETPVAANDVAPDVTPVDPVRRGVEVPEAANDIADLPEADVEAFPGALPTAENPVVLSPVGPETRTIDFGDGNIAKFDDFERVLRVRLDDGTVVQASAISDAADGFTYIDKDRPVEILDERGLPTGLFLRDFDEVDAALRQRTVPDTEIFDKALNEPERLHLLRPSVRFANDYEWSYAVPSKVEGEAPNIVFGSFKWNEETKTIQGLSVYSEKGQDSTSPRVMAKLYSELRKRFPTAERITAHRIGGVRGDLARGTVGRAGRREGFGPDHIELPIVVRPDRVNKPIDMQQYRKAVREYKNVSREQSISYEQEIQGKSAVELTDWVTSKNPTLAPIMEKVKMALEDLQSRGQRFDVVVRLKDTVVPPDVARHDFAALADTNIQTGRNTLYFNGHDMPWRGTSPEIVAHELIHAVTVGVRTVAEVAPPGTRIRKFNDDLDDILVAARETLLARREDPNVEVSKFEEEVWGQLNNALDNADELLAWALTDMEAQAFLSTVPYKGTRTTLWGKFVDTVMNLLGLSPRDNPALAGVLQAFDRLTYSASYDEVQRIAQTYGPGWKEIRENFSRKSPMGAGTGDGNGPSWARNMTSGRGAGRLQPANDLPEGLPEIARQRRRTEEIFNESNINPNNIRGTAGIDEVISEAALGIERTAQSWEETDLLAKELGLTPKQLIDYNPNLTPEMAVAARRMLVASSNNIVRLFRKINRGDQTEETINEALKAWALHGAIQERVQNLTATAARVLNSFRMEVTGDDFSAMFRSVPNDVFRDPANIQRLAKMIDEAAEQGNLGAVNTIVQNSFRKNAHNYIFSFWYNNVLSNPATHVINIAGTGLNVGMNLGHRLGAAVLGQRGRLSTSGDADRVMVREIGAQVFGMMSAFWNGQTWKDAGKAFKLGEPLHKVSRVEHNTTVLPSRLSYVFEAPTRFLAASDEWFRGIITAGEHWASAYRDAHKKGLTGNDMIDHIRNLVKNPTEEMVKRANDQARTMQFLAPPSLPSRKMIELLTVRPGDDFTTVVAKTVGGLFFPFLRTTDNLVRTAVRYSPLGFISKTNRADFLAGGARRDMAVARIATGFAMTGMFYSAAAEGLITGQGPSDYRKRAELEASGWQPNSIKVGDEYISYLGLEPLSIILNVAATMAERQAEEGLEATAEAMPSILENAFSAAASTAGMLADSTFAGQIFELGGALENARSGKFDQAKSSLANAIGSVAGGLVPASSLMRQINQVYFDPYTRDTTGDGSLEDRIANRAVFSVLPGLSQTLPAKVDVYGRPVSRADARLGPDILSRTLISKEEKDPVIQELAALGKSTKKTVLAPPKKTLSEKYGGRRLTAEEYNQYSYMAGTMVVMAVGNLMDTPEYYGMTNEERIKSVKKIAEKTRKAVREELFGTPDDNGIIWDEQPQQERIIWDE